MFRGTPHYPQRAKSSILTILTSHSKATLQSHTAKPSGTAAQFHSTFRSGNPDNPTSIAFHITVSSYTGFLFHLGIKSVLLLKNSVIAPFTEKATLSSLELYTSKREDIEFGMGILEAISATFAGNIIGIQP